jgi:hypothetical protein
MTKKAADSQDWLHITAKNHRLYMVMENMDGILNK